MINLRRATLGWLRAVVAPNTICLLIVVIATLIALWVLAMHYSFESRYGYILGRHSNVLNLFVFLLSGMAAYYGLMRSTVFHPALDYRYHEWLRSTPWTPGSPLPKGPLAPVWQDAVVLTTLTIVAATYAGLTENPIAATLGPCFGMAIGLTTGWTLANVITRNLVAAYGALLAAPLALHATMQYGETSFSVSAVAAAIVSYVGVAVGLRSYPWTIFPKDKLYLARILNPHDERTLNWKLTASVGWPYVHLLTPPSDCRFSRRRATTEAIIAAAWASALTRFITLPDQPVAWGAVSLLTMGAMSAKLMANLPLVCPKFCLGERIAKRRPIIWRHDRIFVDAIAVGVGVTVVAAIWFRAEPGPHWVGVGIAAAVGVWLFRRLGRPAVERFYTGPQMIAGIAIQPQNFKRLASPGE